MASQAQKAAMYNEAQASLTPTALSLKAFSEDTALFVDNQPTQEQQQARQDYQQLVQMIGRFVVEAKVNESAK